MSTTTKTPAKRVRAKHCRITASVRRLVIERGALGITNAMVQQDCTANSTNVGTVLAKMTNRGEIKGAQVPGAPKRWFANDELAQRWLATAAPKPKPPPAPRQAVKRWREPTAAQNVTLLPGRAAPVTVRPRPDTTDVQPHVPAHVKVQRVPAPTHDKRYQCAPGERPAGAGFAAAGIGRDITTGRAWGQQA